MTIMDLNLEMMDAQALATVAAGVINSTYVDFGAAVDEWNTAKNPDMGVGSSVWMHARIGTACTYDTADATLAFVLLHSSDATTWSTLTGFVQSAATMANYTAGVWVFNNPLPADTKRYLKLTATTATSAVTAGTLDAWLDLSAGTP